MSGTNSKSLIKTFLHGEAVFAFWNFSTKGVGIFNTFLTISSLTLYQYGVFQLLLSIAGLSFDVTNLGGGVISNEITRAVGEKREADAKKIYLEYFFTRMSLAVLLWAIVFFGSTYIFSSYSLDFIKDMRVISFLFITEVIFLTIRILCLVRLKLGIIGIRATLNKSIQFAILLFFFAQGNLGLKQLIWSIVVSSALSVILILPQFFRVFNEWKGVTASPRKLLFNIFVTNGTWEVSRQLINKATFRIKPWLIKLFISTEAVAIFSIAEMIISTLQDVLPSKTLQSIVPLWLKEKKLSAKMFSFGVKYYFITGLGLVIFALIIVPPVVNTFFAKYKESLSLFYFMILNLPIFAVGIVTGNYVVAHRKQKFLFFLHLSRNVFALLVIFCTLPFIGLWGLAIESVTVPFLMTFGIYLYTKKRTPGFYFDKKIIFGFSNEDRAIVKKLFLEIKSIFFKIKTI